MCFSSVFHSHDNKLLKTLEQFIDKAKTGEGLNLGFFKLSGAKDALEGITKNLNRKFLIDQIEHN